MSYCMYLRKSRADLEAEARGEGETLKRHEKILLELARKMNIFIGEDAIYREIVSAETIASRPVMQQLLSEVEQGKWKGVFVAEVERLARGDTIDQGIVAQAFKYSNTKIITPLKIYDPSNEYDEEYFEFGLFMSRREYKTINRRLQRGRFQSVKEGKYIGSIAPYGYRRRKLEKDKGYTLEPHPDEAPIVKLIFEWYTKGELQKDGTYQRLGVSRIMNRLNEMKVPTRKGGDWTTSTIRDILINPVYIGKIRRDWRPEVKKIIDGEVVIERPRNSEENVSLFDGLHPAIIDVDTFRLAQEYMAKNPSLPVPTRYKVMNPLAGLIECGMCGRKMNRKPYKSGSPDTLLCTGPTCPNVSSPLYIVEEKLLKVLEVWLKNYKLEIKQREERGTNLEISIIKKSIKNIDKELETIEKQLNSLHDLLEQGIYSVDKFLERSRILNEKKDAAKTNKKVLENKLKSVSTREVEEKHFIPKVERVIDLYWKLADPKDRNHLLKEVLEKAIYIKEEGGRWSGKVDKFMLKIFPKTPK